MAMVLTHLMLHTGRVAKFSRADVPYLAVEECREVLLCRGGPLPGELCAFRLDDLLIGDDWAAFQIMRGRENLVWVIVCATEFAADRQWEDMSFFTAAARPPAPWVCVLHEPSLRWLAAADVGRVENLAPRAAWAALELLIEPEV